MLKTYSMDGNYNKITIELRNGNGRVKFPVEFMGGDAERIGGTVKRSTYKTGNPLEQFAIETHILFKRGKIRLDSCVETQEDVNRRRLSEMNTAAREAAGIAAPAEHVETPVDDSGLNAPEDCKCFADAVAYCMKEYNVEKTKINRVPTMRKFMKENNLAFPNVESLN